MGRTRQSKKIVISLGKGVYVYTPLVRKNIPFVMAYTSKIPVGIKVLRGESPTNADVSANILLKVTSGIITDDRVKIMIVKKTI